MLPRDVENITLLEAEMSNAAPLGGSFYLSRDKNSSG